MVNSVRCTSSAANNCTLARYEITKCTQIHFYNKWISIVSQPSDRNASMSPVIKSLPIKLKLWYTDKHDTHNKCSTTQGYVSGVYDITDKSDLWSCNKHSSYLLWKVSICNYRSCLQWEPCDRLGQGKGHWSRIRQIWKTHKGGDMIRKTDNMNQDEGSYQFSQVWDKLLRTDHRYRKSVLIMTSDVKSKRR